MSVFPGELLQQRYQIGERLGHSTLANTYLAQDRKTRMTVVVKELNFRQVDSLRLLKPIQHETLILKSIAHPGMPRCLDNFEQIRGQNFSVYVVQQKEPGTNVRQKLEEGWRASEAEAEDIARQILDILIYLQTFFTEPILHRDIKPSNLILDQTGKVSLIDPGSIREVVTPIDGTTVFGTHAYMAPEQLAGAAVPASDLFSLGTTLLHMLSGVAPSKLPYQKKQLKAPPPAPMECTPEFADWLAQMTAPNLEERFATAEEALNSLNQLGGFEPESGPEDSQAPQLVDSSAEEVVQGSPIPILDIILVICTIFGVSSSLYLVHLGHLLVGILMLMMVLLPLLLRVRTARDRA
ncbi:MAG: serine/threonine protein kinase [Candidatus Sericytochromatia bacterium]